MELSPASEAVSFTAAQVSDKVLWNPRANYSVHKSPPLVPIMRKVNPVH
jgi:hypothetical protein